jgi:hypothetical protein
MLTFSHQLARLRRWHRRRQLADRDRTGALARREIRRILVDWLGRAWPYLLGLVAGTATMALLAYLIVPDALATFAVGAVVASGPWVGYVLWLDSSGIANLRAGIDGEHFTVSELRPLLRSGWRLVNHVLLEHRDVDHVLLGPGGLFAIETKYRSRWHRVPDDELKKWAEQASRDARDLHLRTERLQHVTPIVVMWGPHVADAAPAPKERGGVTLCAGRDLLTAITRVDASLDEPSIERVYEALDTYVRKRTIGEERDHGPNPRPIADHILDLLVGVLAGFLSIISVAYIARLDPILVSYPLACVALITLAAAARRSWLHPRIRALSTGVLASAIVLLVVATVVEVVARISR